MDVELLDVYPARGENGVEVVDSDGDLKFVGGAEEIDAVGGGQHPGRPDQGAATELGQVGIGLAGKQQGRL